MHCLHFSEVTKQYLSRFYEILDTMICGMTQAELTQSISHNFIVQMIPHHEAAIRMSQNILQYTTLVPLQNIAQNIVEMQTKSIAYMQDALKSCSDLVNTQEDLRLYQICFHQISETMFCKMQNARSTNQINANFMREMIPHHEGAIQMSGNALRYPICSELKPILEEIISSQERGVLEMRRLLCRIPA